MTGLFRVSEQMPSFFKYRHYALAILTLTYVFNFLDRQLLAILLEPIKAEFDASDSAMGLLYGLAFALFYATLAIPIARMADKGNRRNILAIAAGLWSLMTMLCGLAANYWQLLLLRIGVAVGEAGGVPPSQSMVNDLYPPAQRARAMAVFASATFIGTLLAMVAGSYIAQTYGWRAAFLVVGAPGILLAIIIRFTVTEPQRGAWDTPRKETAEEQPGLIATFLQMWRLQALRCIMIGSALAGMAGYGLGFWSPAFVMRAHSLSIMQAGLMIGGAGATIGLFGSLFGGWLCDRLSQKSRNWLMYIPAISLLLSLPPIFLFLIFPETSIFFIGSYAVPVAMLFFCITSLVGSWWAAPPYVAVQEMVAPKQRTLACATLLFIMNLVGFGLGPFLVGILSDLLTPRFGSESLRYALMLIMITYLPAALYYYRAGRIFSQQRYDANLIPESA